MTGLSFQINDWTIIVDENRLYHHGKTFNIEPRLINLLSFLAQNPNTVFTRDELIDSVWSNGFVSEQVVTQSIFELRKILKEDNVPSMIVTVPKRGYKLQATVTPMANSDIAIIERPTPLKSEVSFRPLSDDALIQPFPAAPFTRAMLDFSDVEPKKPSRESRGHWLFNACFFLIVAVLLGWLLHSQPQRLEKTVINPNLIAVRVTMAAGLPMNEQQVMTGLRLQLQQNVAEWSGDATRFEMPLTQSRGIVAGKVVSLRLFERDKQPILSVSYYNDTVRRILFERDYSLQRDQLISTYQRMMMDLSTLFSSSASQTHAVALPINGFGLSNDDFAQFLVAKSQVLAMTVSSLTQGLKSLNALVETSPTMGRLLAWRFIAESALVSLKNHGLATPLLHQYGQALHQWTKTTSSPIPEIVWQGLALSGLYQGDFSAVKQALFQANQHTRSPSLLSCILRGKLAELQGHPVKAGEAYTQAYYLDAQASTYRFAQYLAFYSDLSTLAPGIQVQ